MELTRVLVTPDAVLSKPNGRQELAMMIRGRVCDLLDIERKSGNQNYLDRLQRAYSWLWKAYEVQGASDLEARFIFAWIGFNALYGVRRDWLARVGPKGTHNVRPTPGVTDLGWFLWKISNLDSGEGRIVEFLRQNLSQVEVVVKDPFLQEAYWKWDEQETARRRRDDYAAITGSVARRKLGQCLHILFVWRLRTLRNLLMHGSSTNGYSKRRQTEEGEKSLAAAAQIAERGVGCLLAVMEDADHHKWPPTDGPRLESPLHGPLKETPQAVAEEWELFLRSTSWQGQRSKL